MLVKTTEQKKEYEWFITRSGYYEAGTQLRATGGNIDEMLGVYGGSAFESSMYRGNAGNGSGKSGNDTAHKGKPRFKPSQALLNCLRNIEEVPEENGELKRSDRDPDALTPRNLLANALEESAVHEVEKKKLAEYKANIEKLYANEQELYEVRKEIKELYFASGKKDWETRLRAVVYEKRLL